MAPQAPTMASQGLTRISGRLSTGRAPSLSSRVKQSCILRKCVFFASRKSRSENSRQSPMDISRTSGCSIRLNQPMNWVARRRGIRLVSRKLMSSCCTRRSNWVRTVMGLSTPARKPQFDHSRNDLRHIGLMRVGLMGNGPSPECLTLEGRLGRKADIQGLRACGMTAWATATLALYGAGGAAAAASLFRAAPAARAVARQAPLARRPLPHGPAARRLGAILRI